MRLLNKALDSFIKERGMMHIPDITGEAGFKRASLVMTNQAPRVKVNPYECYKSCITTNKPTK